MGAAVSTEDLGSSEDQGSSEVTVPENSDMQQSTDSLGSAVSAPFVIKHLSSGKYIHIHNCSNQDNAKLVFYDGVHEKMYFSFEKIDGDWGYIIHTNSGKIVTPLSEDNSELVINSKREDGGLFCMDPELGTIMHKTGKYLHPENGVTEPDNNHSIILHHDDEDGVDFKIIEAQTLMDK